jgi:hypothetical protein
MPYATPMIQELLIVIPPSETELRRDLQDIMDDTFMELPEDNSVWVRAMRVLFKRGVRDSSGVPWHAEIKRVWDRHSSGSAQAKPDANQMENWK